MMKWNVSFFAKAVMILLLFILSISAVYTYSYYQSLLIMEKELEERNLNRLSIVGNQIDSNFNNLSIVLLSLSEYSTIQQLKIIDVFSDYEQFVIKRDILDQLLFQSAVSSWMADFTVYAPEKKITLQTKHGTGEDLEITDRWELKTVKNKKIKEAYFIKHLTIPNNSNVEVPDIIIEVKIPVKNIKNYLSQLNINHYSHPFMYKENRNFIVSSSVQKEKMKEMISQIPDLANTDRGSVSVVLDKQKYLLSFIRLHELDWTIVDYTLAEDVFAPLTKTRNIFYMFVSLSLLICVLTVYLLYFHIQNPIKNMITAIQQVRQGNYAVRIKQNTSREFQYMISNFNEMTHQLEVLIEEVYKEKIRYQEIYLKQLQLQINPHFLYNCLFIIKNMAKLQQYKGIEAMSLHLGNYYRYMSKDDENKVQIREEMAFIQNYLDIHKIRMQKFTYTMNFDEDLLAILIPKLLIQPIVENALLHGVKTSEEGRIVITGKKIKEENFIIVEDNGMGLTEQDLEKLKMKISTPMVYEGGQGLTNVYQRLQFHFGPTADISFEQSSIGGLKVIMNWR